MFEVLRKQISGMNPDFLIAVGAGLEPARVLLPAAFQERYLTNSVQPTRKFLRRGWDSNPR